MKIYRVLSEKFKSIDEFIDSNKCDMQGLRTCGNYKAPTAFYFEITWHSDGSIGLNSWMHSIDAD